MRYRGPNLSLSLEVSQIIDIRIVGELANSAIARSRDRGPVRNLGGSGGAWIDSAIAAPFKHYAE